MKNRLNALYSFISYSKKHLDFKAKTLCYIFKLAKDKTLSLRNFGVLLKKALNYLNKYQNEKSTLNYPV
jgi:hypothetical protein